MAVRRDCTVTSDPKIPTDDELKAFVTHWMDGPALSQKSLVDLAVRHCPGWHPDEIWTHLQQEQWLRNNSASSFVPSVNAVQWMFKSPVRYTIAEGWSALSQCLDRVHAWNRHARAQNLPQVAAVAVWGSLIRPGQQTCGDVDVALLWRRPENPLSLPMGPPSTLPAGSALLAHLATCPPPAQPSAGAWEEWVEEWLSSVPLMSLSGVDQWDELAVLRSDFSAQCVWHDATFAQHPLEEGTKQWEVDAFLRHAHPARRMDQPSIG